MSPDIELADILVEELIGLNLGEVKTVERTWLANWDLITEGDELQVGVQPSPQPTSEPGERVGVTQYWPIDIGIGRRLKLKTRAEVDHLAGVMDKIRERYEICQIETGGGLNFVNSGAWDFLARYDPSLLTRQKRQADGSVSYAGNFLSVIRFNFRRID